MPKDNTRSIYVAGLRNAHAMERQALSIMRPQATRIEHYPEVAQKLVEHIAETEGQLLRLETILERLGEDKSALKDMALSIVGGMAALGHAAAPDEILKNSFANFAFENFEIAAYKSLLALAGEIGTTADQDSALLEDSLSEEMAMAEWLDQNIEAVTLQYADFVQPGETAKK